MFYSNVKMMFHSDNRQSQLEESQTSISMMSSSRDLQSSPSMMQNADKSRNDSHVMNFNLDALDGDNGGLLSQGEGLRQKALALRKA